MADLRSTDGGGGSRAEAYATWLASLAQPVDPGTPVAGWADTPRPDTTPYQPASLATPRLTAPRATLPGTPGTLTGGSLPLGAWTGPLSWRGSVDAQGNGTYRAQATGPLDTTPTVGVSVPQHGADAPLTAAQRLWCMPRHLTRPDTAPTTIPAPSKRRDHADYQGSLAARNRAELARAAVPALPPLPTLSRRERRALGRAVHRATSEVTR